MNTLPKLTRFSPSAGDEDAFWIGAVDYDVPHNAQDISMDVLELIPHPNGVGI